MTDSIPVSHLYWEIVGLVYACDLNLFLCKCAQTLARKMQLGKCSAQRRYNQQAIVAMTADPLFLRTRGGKLLLRCALYRIVLVIILLISLSVWLVCPPELICPHTVYGALRAAKWGVSVAEILNIFDRLIHTSINSNAAEQIRLVPLQAKICQVSLTWHNRQRWRRTEIISMEVIFPDGNITSWRSDLAHWRISGSDKMRANINVPLHM